MLKWSLRFLAGVLLLVATFAAVNDVTRSLAAGRTVEPVSTYAHWSHLAPVTLDLARHGVQRHTHPLVWDPVIVAALQLPAWALFGLGGVLLAYAGRRRRQINIFAN